MNKEQAVEEFFKELKKTFNIASLFSKDHPLFTKALEDFKKVLETSFQYFNPIKVGVTQDSFMIEDKRLEKGQLYEDMAKMLHLRRIKSIEIRPGVTVQELAAFFNAMSMPTKEMAAKGGIECVLEKGVLKNISVSQLDYSQLLMDSGSECKDIWVYLLNDAVDMDNPEKARQLADNFQGMIRNFSIKDIMDNPEYKEKISKFLFYLKEKNRPGFIKCAKEMAGLVLKEKDSMMQKQHIETVKGFLSGLDSTDFADLISENILNEEQMDSLNFGLFFNIMDADEHKKIAPDVAATLGSKRFKDNAKIKKNIQRLFSSSENAEVSQVYRNTLSSLLKDIAGSKETAFDRQQAHRDYQMILLNLLYEETDPVRLSSIVERINAELDDIIHRSNIEYLVYLLECITKKRSEGIVPEAAFGGLERSVFTYVEHKIVEEGDNSGLRYFVNNLSSSALGLDFYLDRIFNEKRVNTGMLRLFFKLFGEKEAVFCKKLEQKGHDLEFLEKMVDAMKGVDDPCTLDSLKCIYSFANNFIKIEVLKAMQAISAKDEAFLLGVLKSGDVAMKKESLVSLMKEEPSRRKAVDALFNIKNPWGTKNNVILENILAVEEANFKAAQDSLVALSKRFFFWNSEIKKEAVKVLKKWAR